MLKSVGDQQQPGNIKVSQTSVQAGAGSKNKKWCKYRLSIHFLLSCNQ